MILRIITLLSEEFSLSLINQRAAASWTNNLTLIWCDSTQTLILVYRFQLLHPSMTNKSCYLQQYGGQTNILFPYFLEDCRHPLLWHSFIWFTETLVMKVGLLRVYRKSEKETEVQCKVRMDDFESQYLDNVKPAALNTIRN